MELVESLGRSFPKKILQKTSEMLDMAGSSFNIYAFVVYVTLACILLFAGTITLGYYFPDFKQIAIGLANDLYPESLQVTEAIIIMLFALAIVAIFLVLFTAYYTMKADARRNALESILPDFLNLVSSNVRSGMNLDQAMWQAAKPEFGILAIEVKKAVKSSFSGEPIEKSLDVLANRFNSDLFKRAIRILKNSIYSGGEIAVILDKISEEASQISTVRREIKSTLIIYVIFLFFASAIGIPFLLSVSMKMLAILTSTFAMVEPGNMSSDFATFSISSPPVTVKQFYYFSLLVIAISSITTSFLIGSTYAGRKSEGIKYLPLILIMALIVFFLAGFALDMFFSNLVP